jgi:hypothetical protein
VATSGTPVARPTSGIVLNQSASSPHSMICIYSLSWLEDEYVLISTFRDHRIAFKADNVFFYSLHDAQREDVATFFFQLWLFTVGLVAVCFLFPSLFSFTNTIFELPNQQILNESLPHLGAALIGHILGGAWASSRISSTKEMGKIYREVIVPRACDNVDLLGSWWDLRLAHTIPLVVLNVLGVIALAFLSWKLLRVRRTFLTFLCRFKTHLFTNTNPFYYSRSTRNRRSAGWAPHLRSITSTSSSYSSALAFSLLASSLQPRAVFGSRRSSMETIRCL